MHNYGELTVAEQSNEVSNRNDEPASQNVCTADDNSEMNHHQIVEKVEENTNDTTQTEHQHTNDEETHINSAESDWQAPVSLKGFKKKLNEIFTVKFVLNKMI